MAILLKNNDGIKLAYKMCWYVKSFRHRVRVWWRDRQTVINGEKCCSTIQWQNIIVC